jgi:crossover junction endodeoxyribonuclease RuvC
MVQRLLQVEVEARADATDALAVALCHLHRSRSLAAGVPARMGKKRDARTLLGDRLASAYRPRGARGAPYGREASVSRTEEPLR